MSSPPPSSPRRAAAPAGTPKAPVRATRSLPRDGTEPAAGPPWAAPGVRIALGLAIVGVTLFVLPLLAVLDRDSTPPLDAGVLALAGELTSATFSQILQVVTNFGALPSTSVVVLAGAVVLMLRRRPAAAAGLVVGFIVLVVAIDLIKNGVGRPRPPQADPSLTTKSFPSGHAGYSTAYTAVAVALATTLGASRARQRALVAGGLLITLVIGLTRPLLRVHYLSDVIGGWGLGCAVFALAAATVLVVVPVRQTGEAGEPPAPEDSANPR